MWLKNRLHQQKFQLFKKGCFFKCTSSILFLFLHILGDDFPNAASLLETVLELQAERERAADSTQDIRPGIPLIPSALSLPGWFACRFDSSFRLSR